MNKHRFLLVIMVTLSVFFVCGCATVLPERFTQIPEISTKGGYVIEAENSSGFALEILYKSYSFEPNPDSSILEARDYFIKVAQRIAQERNKAIEPFVASQMMTNTDRNIVSGFYSVYVSGSVKYAR